jgi:hypothetical protein
MLYNKTRSKLRIFPNASWILLLGCLYVSSLYAEKNQPASGLNLEQLQQSNTKKTKWKNNPFVRKVEDVGIGGLKLYAVIHHPEDAAALINRQIVRAGDKIGTAEVVSIRKHEVLLRSLDGLFKLGFDGRKK